MDVSTAAGHMKRSTVAAYLPVTPRAAAHLCPSFPTTMAKERLWVLDGRRLGRLGMICEEGEQDFHSIANY